MKVTIYQEEENSTDFCIEVELNEREFQELNGDLENAESMSQLLHEVLYITHEEVEHIYQVPTLTMEDMMLLLVKCYVSVQQNNILLHYHLAHPKFIPILKTVNDKFIEHSEPDILPNDANYYLVPRHLIGDILKRTNEKKCTVYRMQNDYYLRLTEEPYWLYEYNLKGIKQPFLEAMLAEHGHMIPFEYAVSLL